MTVTPRDRADALDWEAATSDPSGVGSFHQRGLWAEAKASRENTANVKVTSQKRQGQPITKFTEVPKRSPCTVLCACSPGTLRCTDPRWLKSPQRTREGRGPKRISSALLWTRQPLVIPPSLTHPTHFHSALLGPAFCMCRVCEGLALFHVGQREMARGLERVVHVCPPGAPPECLPGSEASRRSGGAGHSSSSACLYN